MCTNSFLFAFCENDEHMKADATTFQHCLAYRKKESGKHERRSIAKNISKRAHKRYMCLWKDAFPIMYLDLNFFLPRSWFHLMCFKSHSNFEFVMGKSYNSHNLLNTWLRQHSIRGKSADKKLDNIRKKKKKVQQTLEIHSNFDVQYLFPPHQRQL